MIGTVDHKSVLEGKSGSNNQGVEPTCRLSGKVGFISDWEGTLANQSRGKAVHGSVRVEFVPNSKLTRRNQVEKKGTRRRPVGIIESSGSEHQRVAGGLVGFGMVRKQWKKHRSDENLTRFYKISPDLAKISLDSMRFRQIRSKSHRI